MQIITFVIMSISSISSLNVHCVRRKTNRKKIIVMIEHYNYIIEFKECICEKENDIDFVVKKDVLWRAIDN